MRRVANQRLQVMTVARFHTFLNTKKVKRQFHTLQGGRLRKKKKRLIGLHDLRNCHLRFKSSRETAEAFAKIENATSCSRDVLIDPIDLRTSPNEEADQLGSGLQ